MAVEDFAAEMEREKARQRTYDAMVQKVRLGQVVGGRVFGYLNEPVYDSTTPSGAPPRRLYVVGESTKRRPQWSGGSSNSPPRGGDANGSPPG